MDSCEKYEHGDPEDYWKYVHGYFLPWLDEQRQKGKLRYGKFF